MTLSGTARGVQLDAWGFEPGAIVYVWRLGPVMDGAPVSRPARPGAVLIADANCHVKSAGVPIIIEPGRYAYYLAGDRYGGGSELTMFQLIDLTPDSSARGVTPAVRRLSPPTAFTALAMDRGAIQLTWQDHANSEQGFRITMTGGSGGTYGVSANTTTYVVRGLQPNTRYCFNLRALDSQGESAAASTCATTSR
jgi:hypothetical protein